MPVIVLAKDNCLQRFSLSSLKDSILEFSSSFVYKLSLYVFKFLLKCIGLFLLFKAERIQLYLNFNFFVFIVLMFYFSSGKVTDVNRIGTTVVRHKKKLFFINIL